MVRWTNITPTRIIGVFLWTVIVTSVCGDAWGNDGQAFHLRYSERPRDLYYHVGQWHQFRRAERNQGSSSAVIIAHFPARVIFTGDANYIHERLPAEFHLLELYANLGFEDIFDIPLIENRQPFGPPLENQGILDADVLIRQWYALPFLPEAQVKVGSEWKETISVRFADDDRYVIPLEFSHRLERVESGPLGIGSFAVISYEAHAAMDADGRPIAIDAEIGDGNDKRFSISIRGSLYLTSSSGEILKHEMEGEWSDYSAPVENQDGGAGDAERVKQTWSGRTNARLLVIPVRDIERMIQLAEEARERHKEQEDNR